MATSKNDPKKRAGNKADAVDYSTLPRYKAMSTFVPRANRKKGAVKQGTARNRSR